MSESFLKSDFLSSFTNCNVYCKLEFFGPTGSYKDRLAPAALQEAKSKGFTKIVVVSSGNFGLAIAYEAQKQGMECTVLGYDDILPKYQKAFLDLEVNIQLFSTTEDAYRALENYIQKGYFSATVPFSERAYKDTPGISGYETLAYELVKALCEEPDSIILPTCYGDGAKGILNGFLKMQKENLIKDIPKFILVRATEHEGDIAYSISTNQTTPQVEYVLEHSNGESIYVNDQEFIEGNKIFIEQCDIHAEITSGGIITALKRMVDQNIISPKSKIVAIFTAKA